MKKQLSLLVFVSLFFTGLQLRAQTVLIGTAVAGGSGYGSMWKYDISGSTINSTNLINTANGNAPYSSMIKAKNGKFYAVTSAGGANNMGAIVEVAPLFSSILTRVSFNGTGNGSAPYGTLFLDLVSGDLYGTTSTGGANNVGTIFRYTPGASTVTTLYSFATATGSTPKGGFYQNGNYLYGVTSAGGSGGNGVFFRIDKTTFAYTAITHLTTAQGRGSTSTPVYSPNGYLLFTCKQGGANNFGSICKYDFTTFSTVYSFTSAATSGTYPEGDLCPKGQNDLLGLCPTGGQYGNGCLYEFNTINNTLTVRYSFPSTATTMGKNPKGGLVWAPSLLKYVGVANSGGANNTGTVFAYDEISQTVTKKADFTTSTGTGPANINLLEYTYLGATIAKTNVACSGGSTGSATVTPTGGTAPYTYSWNPGGETTASISGKPAGTYQCTVTEAGGTTFLVSTNITQPGTLPSAFASTTSVTCNGASTGSASVSASNGTPGYTYLWTPGGQTTATITGKPAGGYTVTVTDANGCTTNQQVIINQPAAMVTSGTPSSPTCNGGTNGFATAAVNSGGVSPFSYLWNTGWTGSTLSGIGAGTYTCTITDNNGCPKTQTVTVTQPTAITSTVTSVTNVLCNGGSTGAASLSASGGTPGYTYSWVPSSGTAATITGRPAGTYTCTIRDVNNCTATQTLTISQPALLTSGISSQTNITCNGGNNGAATVLAGGGTTPYSYNWTPSGGTSATTTGRTAGTYTCTITDNNGCVKTQTVTLTQPTAITSSISSQTNVTCNGGTNGAATVLAGGGTIPYTYSWTPSGGTAATTTGRPAGTYTCTIRDGANCIKTQPVTITQPSAITSSISSQTNVTCNGGATGAATVLAGGGTTPYTYSWAPSGGTAATTTGRTAGTYTCTITDNVGCVKTQTVTLAQPSAITSSISSQTNILCNGAATGAATVLAGGGTSPYTYSWAPSGGTAATTTGRTAGTYTCTITDNVGCVKTQTVTLTQPGAITSSISSQTNVTCNAGTNGAATVLAGGGTTPYTYNWTPTGGTAATTTGRTAGTYTCTITDNVGCVKTQTVTLTQPSAITLSFSTSNATCGSPNGSATATPSGGTPGYTYQWNAAAGNQTTATATGLLAGSYVVTVTDLAGCTKIGNASVSNSSGPSLTVSSTPATCNGLCNGTATVTPTGGAIPYTYSWAPSGGTAATTSSRCAGTYTITVIDNIGCSASSTVAITEPAAVTASFTTSHISCNGGNNGFSTISVSGGTPGYTYSWAPSGGTGATGTGLIAGTYTCSVTDANSCLSTHTVLVTQPTALSATNSKTNVSCNGGSNGTATAIPSGGTPPYLYSWAPSGGTAPTASGLSAGNYTCTVTDANACVTTTSLTITAPTALNAGSTQTNVTCNGLNDGTATVSASGGTAPYSYSWSPAGGTAASATGLSPSSYTCTITDNNGCFIGRSFTITEPPALSGSSTQSDVSCNGSTNGSATVTPTGGVPSYTYSWAPSGGTTATASGLNAGNYTCTITDANGCTEPVVVSINEPALISTSIFGSNVLCNGGNSGTAGISASGGTPAYLYSWAPAGGTGSTANGLVAGTYTCTVTDANGCITSNNITLTQPTALLVSTTSTDASCNGGADGIAMATPAGGTAGYTYSWSSGGTAATENNLMAGSYTCTTTDANGCSSMDAVTVLEPTAVSVSITPMDASCFGGNDGSATGLASGGTAGYTYSWSSGGTGSTESGLAAGTYTLTATDANTCVGSNTFTINEPLAITTFITGTDANCPGGNSGTATMSASGGTGAFNYNWLPSGGTAATATGLTAGTYTCDVTDANGCPESDIYIISEPAAFNASITQLTNAGCAGSNNGSAQIAVTGGTAPYFYSWNSGGTSDIETGLVANTYTCSFTDNNSCPGSATVTITENTNTDLFGTLSFPGGTIAGGTVYAFKQQSTVNGIDTVATVSINGGASANYLFTGLAPDYYYIKAILDTSLNPTAVPTYYGNTFQWDSSFVVTHGCLQTDTADIDVLELLPSGGTGFISGYIVEGAGYQNLRLFNNGTQPNLPFVPGGPLKGIDVKLGKNPAGGIQARVMTDTNGYYAFHDVPADNYYIYVDIPNLPMDSLRQVTIAPGGDTSLQNNYYADSLFIYITDTMITPVGIYSSAKQYDNNFSIYPNPTTNILNLQFTVAAEKMDASIEIQSAMGDLVYAGHRQLFAKGENMISLKARELNLRAGVYFISIVSDNKRYTQRIVVVE